MAISSEHIAVEAEAALNTASIYGQTLHVQNVGAKTAELGPEGVEAEEGIPLAAEAEKVIDVDPGDVLVAIAAEETTLAVLRV
jgi:hypothetical protein